MKRLFTFSLLCLCAVVSAQNINDVLTYGTENLQGTARYQAMGGAFGALGGDLSALNVNPAGSAVFNNTLISFSGTYFATANDASYFGTVSNNNVNDTNLNQVGGVIVFKDRNENSDWKKLSIAFNYDLARNLDNNYRASGRSNQGIDAYFLDFAQNNAALGDIRTGEDEFIEDAYLDIGATLGFANQQAFLGFQSGIIEPVEDDPSNLDYVRNANYSSVNQQFSRNTIGYNGKYTVNTAAQYKEKLYLGASLNFHSVFRERLDRFIETGYDQTSSIQRTTFDNLLNTTGSGFSLALGAIAKVTETVRLGASYQTPTWYRLSDELSQRVNSDFPDADPNIRFIDFNLINGFAPYRIKTPGKITGSVAVIFSKNGLLSLDYGYQDFSNSELRPANDPAFQSVNNDIATSLGAVSTLRVGGEYRISRVSLRAGYRYEQSPYTNGITVGDLNAISGGIGYNFGANRLDFALSSASQDVSERIVDTGLVTPISLNRTFTNATLSYTINF